MLHALNIIIEFNVDQSQQGETRLPSSR